MEWSNETVMEFLDLYEQEQAIWNPQHADHKDRNKVFDAWTRIQSSLSVHCSMKDIKKKKENLMSTYRKLAMRVKNSNSTGSGTSEVYKPEWFAFEKMSTFLHMVYTPRNTKSTGVENPKDGEIVSDDEDNSIGTNIDEEIARTIEDQADSNSNLPTSPNSSESTDKSVMKGGPPLGKKRKADQVTNIGRKMDEAYQFLKQVAAKPKPTKDESTLFCDLLCVKLKNLDDETRAIVMHEIDNIMFTYRKSNIQTNSVAHPHATTSDYQYNYAGQHFQPQNATSSRRLSSSCTSATSSNTNSTYEENTYSDQETITIAKLFTNFKSNDA